jgi:2'-5' RNA ligase superfamily
MDTSVIACFPDADPLVGRWRMKFDPWAAHGIGAHATVASPFLPDDRVDAGVIARVGAIAARHSVALSFATIDLLPGALALCPAAADPLIALTADIATAWPEITTRLRTGRSRPYHLTIACSTDDAIRSEVISSVASALPVQLRAARLDIVAHNGDSAHVVAAVPLATDAPCP